MAAPLPQSSLQNRRLTLWGQSTHGEYCSRTRAHLPCTQRRLCPVALTSNIRSREAASGAGCGGRGKTAMHASGVQLGDLAAAHQTESNIRPPAALLCVPTTSNSVNGALQEIAEAKSGGAQVVELRLDYLEDFNLEDPLPALEKLLGSCKAQRIPAIVTFRPSWEGGKFIGPEAIRLAVLKFASTLQPAYIDVELLAADFFFSGAGTVPIGTNVILSHHDYSGTPSDEELDALVAKMVESGADIAKIATTATDISDSLRMLQLPGRSEGPVIALAMGERGLPSRLLASKFGSHLTFGCLGAGRGSAPGQPTITELNNLYRLPDQTPSTQVYGVVGNPVGHSRSPALHNAALQAAGLDAVYLPYLVDDMASFLRAFEHPDFKGFSVTIPHKLAALEAATEVDPVAKQIGAINTLVRQPDGGLKGYNTDYSAAIGAVEAALEEGGFYGPGCDPEACEVDFGEPPPDPKSPLDGMRVVVLGAGGAGKALAFGAAAKGAKVVVANRNRERAEELCRALGQDSEAADLAAVASGEISGDVLLNSTAVGMHPATEDTLVPKEGLKDYNLVFDAVYTPVETQLLKDAKSLGKLTVSGLEMFVGQAAQQFKLFTDKEAPVDLMRKAVLDSISSS